MSDRGCQYEHTPTPARYCALHTIRCYSIGSQPAAKQKSKVETRFYVSMRYAHTEDDQPLSIESRRNNMRNMFRRIRFIHYRLWNQILEDEGLPAKPLHEHMRLGSWADLHVSLPREERKRLKIRSKQRKQAIKFKSLRYN